jgi:NAD(P)-dependent dehydrogenase (short-subunit alcohol dehydrogenase family)
MEGLRFDFSGCRVLVTGGTSGIGFGVASAFAESGAEVLVTGRRASASEYDRDLSGFAYHQAEMTDPDSLDALVAGIDRLDVLINNAGTNLAAKDEWKPEVFAEAVQLHLMSSFRLSVSLKPLLAKSGLGGGGSIVNCASMSAIRCSRRAAWGAVAASSTARACRRFAPSRWCRATEPRKQGSSRSRSTWRSAGRARTSA